MVLRLLEKLKARQPIADESVQSNKGLRAATFCNIAAIDRGWNPPERIMMKNNVSRILSHCFAIALLLFRLPVDGKAQTPEKLGTSTEMQFASGRSSRRIPFEFVGNHIYLRIRVNKSAPLSFFLDTGAADSYFDVKQVTALGLKVQEDSVKGLTLSLPGITLMNQSIRVRPLGFSVDDGRTIDGMLGYDFINRFVMEIDYVAKTISLYEPRSYRYTGLGNIIPLIMLEADSGGKVPLVNASITEPGRNAIEGKFIADTGVRNDLSYNIPFAEQNKMMQSSRTIPVFIGGGAMVQEGKWLLARVSTMRLGRFDVGNAIAGKPLDTNTTGVLASPEFDGVIGAGILRRFKVIFDYSRERMILEPNKHFKEAYEYDMSGMLLIVDRSNFTTILVRRVNENSPASAKGVQAGDMILSINGKSTDKFTLDEVRQLFKLERRSFRLSIKRGGQIIQVKIKTEKLI